MSLYRQLCWILMLFALVATPVVGESSFSRVSYVTDQWGHNASFWSVRIDGKSNKVLKIKSGDKLGEADFVFQTLSLEDFESKLAEFKRAPNTQKSEGVTVYWTSHYADATLNLLFLNFHGTKLKVVQVVQEKAGQPKQEHQITVDQSYNDFVKAIRKAKSN